jgi:hypothetical protein
LTALAVGVLPAGALARDVYLNGVKLGPDVVIKNQNFPACEVKIDDNGDVWITAKGFKIDVAGPKETPKEAPKDAPKAQAKLEKQYWLISRQPQGRAGMAQYDVDVFINGKFVKKVRSAGDPVLLDVTRWVKPGDNTVQLVAAKNMGAKRLSASPTDTLEIIVGEGTSGGGTVSITRPLVTYTRTAQETKGFTDSVTFTGR